MVRICARALVLTAALLVLFAGRDGTFAQQPPPPGAQTPGQPPGGGRGGPQPPKNIQVLKDVPPDQINLTMQYIAASLGVQCNYCHVQGQNDSDDKDTKKVAREMMKMVDKVNATFFDGKPRVSCASCHNGRAKPLRTPPLAIDMTQAQAAAAAAGRGRGGPGGPGGPGAPAGAPGAVAGGMPGGAPGGPPAGPGGQGRGFAEPPPPPVPTESVDDIVAKYVQALGGQQAVQNAKTRVMTGTVTTRDLVTSNVTVQEKSTGAYRIDIATQPNPTTRATNGTAAWAIGGGGGRGGGGAPDEARDLAGFQMQQGLRLADFALPLGLKTRYSSLLVNKAYDTIDGKQVVVITGTTVSERDRAVELRPRERAAASPRHHDRFGRRRLQHHESARADRLQRLPRCRRPQGGAHGAPRDVEPGHDREVHGREDQRAGRRRSVREAGAEAVDTLGAIALGTL